MDPVKPAADDRSAEQAASLFRSPDPEDQRRATTGKKINSHWKVIIAVLLLFFLVVVLAVAFSLKKGSQDKEKVWLQGTFEDLQLPQCPTGFDKPPVILVSLDGFRAEYLKDHSSHVPVINALRKYGTTTLYMRPVYPTKTFPNHYSIVTGLYPESHGIVDNKMYDVKRNAFFSLRSDEKLNAEWYQGEPVWVTAMRQNLKTATFFWPGSDVNITGTFPTFYHTYDKNINFEKRVTTMLEWLSLPQEQRPDFFTVYLDEPDSAGHRYGPGSKEVVEALENVDRIIGMLMDGLKERNLHKCVNLMVVSDHGMEEASCDKAMFVSSLVNNTEDFSVIQGPAARIRPTHLPEEYSTFDYEGLIERLSCRTPDQPMTPYLKEHLPKRMHFAHHQRIERGHLYMKEGWQASMTRKDMKYCTGGFHGSDNLFRNMQAIFIGYGPGFKHKTVVPPFENIEVYNLVCDLLGIRPAPNNGTHGSLNHLLKRALFQPVHPAQQSHDVACEASNPTPTDDRQCSACNQTLQMQKEMNTQLLSIDSGTKAQLRSQHHLFGTPRVVEPDVSFCLLHHRDFLSGYSLERLMPLWVSYTLRPLAKVGPVVDPCVRADVRVDPSQTQRCSRYRDGPGLTFGLLHPPNLDPQVPGTDSLLNTNMVPMFPAFLDIWEHFHSALLPKYSQQLNGVNIIAGPIFDQDYDGNVDKPKEIVDSQAPTPTHFFLMLTSCGNSSLSPRLCSGPLRVQSFVLPHRPDYSEHCSSNQVEVWVEKWMKFHTARVRDIELLTGLSFYHDRISVDETLRLKTYLHSA
ncbi:ectonucleotide pyrophosphatase/phosphodiesterase family member 1 [Eucyclogobius newberryi]|uniref:ectonucleotide pyrophosphatase/phosphodiesterase family member 1 n=1 Tax=Eucyclogobius newberryi TaxID=166745 RepID=UPI003B597739